MDITSLNIDQMIVGSVLQANVGTLKTTLDMNQQLMEILLQSIMVGTNNPTGTGVQLDIYA
ncbi:MAG: hypothetical protein ABGX24_06665 [Aquificota bacterium]|jgi:hypothetical protein